MVKFLDHENESNEDELSSSEDVVNKEFDKTISNQIPKRHDSINQNYLNNLQKSMGINNVERIYVTGRQSPSQIIPEQVAS